MAKDKGVLANGNPPTKEEVFRDSSGGGKNDHQLMGFVEVELRYADLVACAREKLKETKYARYAVSRSDTLAMKNDSRTVIVRFEDPANT